MTYINVGAMFAGTDAPVPTKKALRETMKRDPSEIMFYATSEFHNVPTTYSGESLPKGSVLVVVGPDPYNNRKWYANVTENGKVT